MASVLLAGAGCDTAPIYANGAQRMGIGTVPDQSIWSASGAAENPEQAIDGNIHTAAVVSGVGKPAKLTIDLGKPATFNMVVIDHGREEFGFARRVEIHTSLDGERFTRRLAGPGTRRVSTFLLDSPVLARYVRIDGVMLGQKAWTLAEVHLQ